VTKDHPDHHDAELVIRLYDLRRESVMRDARKAIAGFAPKAFNDLAAITKGDHPSNAAFRQVHTYWEMVFGMARQGVIHSEFLVENNGEGLFVFAKVERFLDELRKIAHPKSFYNAEWAAKNTVVGRESMERHRAQIARMLAG
jgi:hypothetical protein